MFYELLAAEPNVRFAQFTATTVIIAGSILAILALVNVLSNWHEAPGPLDGEERFVDGEFKTWDSRYRKWIPSRRKRPYSPPPPIRPLVRNQVRSAAPRNPGEPQRYYDTTTDYFNPLNPLSPLSPMNPLGLGNHQSHYGNPDPGPAPTAETPPVVDDSPPVADPLPSYDPPATFDTTDYGTDSSFSGGDGYA